MPTEGMQLPRRGRRLGTPTVPSGRAPGPRTTRPRITRRGCEGGVVGEADPAGRRRLRPRRRHGTPPPAHPRQGRGGCSRTWRASRPDGRAARGAGRTSGPGAPHAGHGARAKSPSCRTRPAGRGGRSGGEGRIVVAVRGRRRGAKKADESHAEPESARMHGAAAGVAFRATPCPLGTVVDPAGRACASAPADGRRAVGSARQPGPPRQGARSPSGDRGAARLGFVRHRAVPGNPRPATVTRCRAEPPAARLGAAGPRAPGARACHAGRRADRRASPRLVGTKDLRAPRRAAFGPDGRRRERPARSTPTGRGRESPPSKGPPRDRDTFG
jgi:hypothetical protein